MTQQVDIPTVGLLLEQTLGHVSHGRNLRNSLLDADEADVRCRDLPFDALGPLDRLPPRSNWTIRAGLAARAALREMQHEAPLDALLVHTHVPATLLGSVMNHLPTVISIDATPHQIDTLGAAYEHRVHPGPIESLKWRLHRKTFQQAASLITWSDWAADSLVSHYGVDRRLIDVIPPGVVNSQWRRRAPRDVDIDVVRVLFVGGDFERKGGGLLLDAVELLNQHEEVRAGRRRIELHLVTSTTRPAGPGVHFHTALTPNSPELIELYHRCDVFALPTRGDCSPLVLAEAAASGLPAVTTDVGAIRETVIDGVTGHLVEPTVQGLIGALSMLVFDDEHRERLGRAAAEHAASTMDAEANAGRILHKLIEHARPSETSGKVVLTVSGKVDSTIRDEIAAGARPLADYVAISDATGASLVDHDTLRTERSVLASIVQRVAGTDVAMAFHLFRRRHRLDVVITDGEQVGLPLAAMLRFAGRARMRHVMIGHRLSSPKKTILIRLLGLDRGVDEVLVYSTSQLEVARALFDRPAQRARLIDFMVDTGFFSPRTAPGESAPRPLICTAGREYRDYPTLIEAVRDLDVDTVIASASPWSKRADNARQTDLPAHVEVTSLSQRELRDHFARSAIVVVPLQPTNFQAGVTTILEAMAMAVPVICTATVGQIDVVVDGVNGRYVPPGDVAAMRRAIEELLADPDAAAAMGRRGRELVETRADVLLYADQIAEIVDWHLGIARPAAVDPVRADRA